MTLLLIPAFGALLEALIMKLTLRNSFLMHAVVFPFTVCGFAAVAQAATDKAAALAAPVAPSPTPIDVCVGKQVGAAVTFKSAQGETVTAVCILSAMPVSDILAVANAKPVATSLVSAKR